MSEEESKKIQQSNDNRGRPTVVTPEKIRQLEQAWAFGCSDPEACVYAEISTSSLYRYEERNPEFRERKRLLKQKPILMARRTIVNELDDNPKYAWKYLEKKAPDFKDDQPQERPTTQLQANEMHFHSDGNKNIIDKFVNTVKEQNELPDGESVEGTTE